MVSLSLAQRGTLTDLKKCKIALHLLGVELETRCPVVWIRDQRRKFPMVVGRDGAGYFPRFQVRKFSEEEIIELQPLDAEVLLDIPMVDEITPEVLKEEWFEKTNL